MEFVLQLLLVAFVIGKGSTLECVVCTNHECNQLTPPTQTCHPDADFCFSEIRKPSVPIGNIPVTTQKGCSIHEINGCNDVIPDELGFPPMQHCRESCSTDECNQNTTQLEAEHFNGDSIYCHECASGEDCSDVATSSGSQIIPCRSGEGCVTHVVDRIGVSRVERRCSPGNSSGCVATDNGKECYRSCFAGKCNGETVTFQFSQKVIATENSRNSSARPLHCFVCDDCRLATGDSIVQCPPTHPFCLVKTSINVVGEMNVRRSCSVRNITGCDEDGRCSSSCSEDFCNRGLPTRNSTSVSTTNSLKCFSCGAELVDANCESSLLNHNSHRTCHGGEFCLLTITTTRSNTGHPLTRYHRACSELSYGRGACYSTDEMEKCFMTCDGDFCNGGDTLTPTRLITRQVRNVTTSTLQTVIRTTNSPVELNSLPVKTGQEATTQQLSDDTSTSLNGNPAVSEQWGENDVTTSNPNHGLHLRSYFKTSSVLCYFFFINFLILY